MAMYTKDDYDNAQKALQDNLEQLFDKYRSQLSNTQHVDALISVRQTGYSMIKNVNFLYFPHWLIASQNSDEKNNNYHRITDFYNTANELITCLLADDLNQSAIEEKRQAFETTRKAVFPANHNRVDFICSAFGSALILLAGIIAMGIGFLLAPAQVGIPLAFGGMFTSVLGGIRLGYCIEHANNSGKKKAEAFSTAVNDIVDDIVESRGLTTHVRATL